MGPGPGIVMNGGDLTKSQWPTALRGIMGEPMVTHDSKRNLLRGARAYLSGPMDFVASRAAEKRHGWRNRVSTFLAHFGVTVFDPWHKPAVRGMQAYGEEDEKTISLRDHWSFAPGAEGAEARARCAATFGETVHIDLRMVDISDFIIAYCPTNIYSVGTPHEVIVATQQHKPVLFVSPPVSFPALRKLEARAAKDPELRQVLDALKAEVPIRENPQGVPSLWYMPIVGSENFFDGFGFAAYKDEFNWSDDEVICREVEHPPQRPLLPFLHGLASGHYPQRWSSREQCFKADDDWLLLEDALEQGLRAETNGPDGSSSKPDA